MQFRGWLRPCWIGGLAALAAAIPPYLVSPQAARISATFLGLFAAGILPTISLLLQSVNSTGKSVYRIDELEAEISKAVDDLFRILGAAGCATFVLLALSIETPEWAAILQTEGALHRLGHAAVGASIAFAISKSGQIPATIRRSLSIRFAQARYEAKKSTRDAAPDAAEIKAAFPKRPGFGKRHQLDTNGDGK